MSTKSIVESVDKISPLIRTIRGQRVILDSDLALIYGVETKTLNRAVKRNIERFPDEFMFMLEPEELASLRCQFGTSNKGRGGRRSQPLAFTEHGALMASTVLSSPQAIAMNIYIIRAFVKMREDQIANAAIIRRLAEIDRTLLVHDTALRDIYEKLSPLLVPPPNPPRPKISFHEAPVPYRISRNGTRRP